MAMLGLRCCVDFSLVAVHRLLIGVACLVAELGPRAPGLPQLQHMGSTVIAPRLESTGSVVVVHGLSCSGICEIFPDHGWKLGLLHWRDNSLPLSPRNYFKGYNSMALNTFTFSITRAHFQNSFHLVKLKSCAR